MTMPQRKLGRHSVGAIGFGAMSFAGFFGEADDEVSMTTLQAAVDAGINHWDTANVYGMGRSENLIGRYFREMGDPGIVLATKASIVRGAKQRYNNDPAYLRAELEASLERLGRDKVELFYMHRREAERPIEEAAEGMARLIEDGLIDGYGLSEVAPSTIRRAHAVCPVTAVQNEYSLWTRLPELGVIQTCKELGITFVPFSPVGRGAFSESDLDPTKMAQADFRRGIPRFIEPNWRANKKTIAALRNYAHGRGWTLPAMALAWVLARGDHLLPIPGTRTPAHLKDWLPAAAIALTPEDFAAIETIAPVGWAHGDRYGDAQASGPERYC